MSNSYKLVTLHSPGWAGFDAATLLISVGQAYHDGEKFMTTVEWAARHFRHLHILVADTLQRHNAPGDWRARGTAWIQRNRAAWAGCGRPVTISRWDDWLSKPELPAILEQFRVLADDKLRAAIDQDAAAFVARQTAKGLGVPVEQSRRYLLEELAAITLQARSYPGVRIYPGPELASFHAVAGGLVPDAPRGLERQYHTAIDFKRRASARLSSSSNGAPAPQPDRYRVRVNSCPAWVGYRTCTLGISVGQPYHEGDKFAATVEWAARHFEHIRVDVSDTLQRHRLIGEGVPPQEAAALSLRAGDQWIERAAPVFGDSGRPHTIVRWDAWLRHRDFRAVFDAYSGLAQSDPVLSAAIAGDVDGFLARQAKRVAPVADENWMRAASRAYLIEELAVITLQGAAECSARIYPGPELACFKAVREGRVPAAPPGLDRDYYVHVNLEHRRAPAARPQSRAAAPASVLKIA